MARKLTGNPVVDCRNAYEEGLRQGYQKGYSDGCSDGGKEVIQIARHLAKLPLYNIVHKYIKSEKKQNEMVYEYAMEDDRLYSMEFWDNKDKVKQALRGVKRIYKETGLIDYGFDIDETKL